MKDQLMDDEASRANESISVEDKPYMQEQKNGQARENLYIEATLNDNEMV